MCIHVQIEDAAFHDLKAQPVISVKKSCGCQHCITLVQSLIQEMKQHLEKITDERAEGSTGSSGEKSGDLMEERMS